MIRFIPLSIGCIAALAATGVLAQNAALQTNEENLRAIFNRAVEATAAKVAADKARPRLGGYWTIAAPMDALVPTDAKAAPLNAAGRKLYNQRVAARRAGKADDPANFCTPLGTPRDMLSPGPFLLVQTPEKVTVYHQNRHLIRHVYLDGPLKLNPAEPDPWWQGHVSGRWEGDTLIMETGDFNGLQWIDNLGLPQSPTMRISERFRLVDANTMEDVITIDDAKYYSKPWTARVTFKRIPAVHLIQDECGEKLLEFPLKAYAPGG